MKEALLFQRDGASTVSCSCPGRQAHHHTSRGTQFKHTRREERRRRKEETRRRRQEREREREEAEKVGRGARGERSSRADGRKEGRKGYLCGLKCAIKGFGTNKHINESKPVIRRRWGGGGGRRGTSPRCVDAEQAAAERADSSRVPCFSAWISLLMFFKVFGELR